MQSILPVTAHRGKRGEAEQVVRDVKKLDVVTERDQRVREVQDTAGVSLERGMGRARTDNQDARHELRPMECLSEMLDCGEQVMQRA